ncbi:MAG TPA: MTH938/NDUFAF3 family protein [Woeseiaceae bacterium]|nr:MTH938/NDUFAF3 family protein [Woeseiaceae bacterium]
MQIAREPNSSVTVRRVEPGEVRIGDRTIRQDVVITPDREILDWPSGDVAQLEEDDFASLLALEPEVIVLGTGWASVVPPRELVFAMARRGIGFEAMTTPAACRTFNILVQEERRAAAVLLLQEPVSRAPRR